MLHHPVLFFIQKQASSFIALFVIVLLYVLYFLLVVHFLTFRFQTSCLFLRFCIYIYSRNPFFKLTLYLLKRWLCCPNRVEKCINLFSVSALCGSSILVRWTSILTLKLYSTKHIILQTMLTLYLLNYSLIYFFVHF